MRCLVGIVFILTERLKAGTWFGFVKVDMEILKPFWPKFEDMLPFFYDRHVPVEPVPQHRKDYLQHTDRKRGNGKKSSRGFVSAKVVVHYCFGMWNMEQWLKNLTHPVCNARPPRFIRYFQGSRYSEVCSRWKKSSSIQSSTRRKTDILRPRLSKDIRLYQFIWNLSTSGIN